MSKENRKLLADALRSGKYEQGKAYLNKGGKMCCLGVGCEVYQEHVGDLDKVTDACGAIGYDYCHSYMPRKAADWFGFDHEGRFVEPLTTTIIGQTITTEVQCNSLVTCNDTASLDFKTIAGLIETKEFLPWNSANDNRAEI